MFFGVDIGSSRLRVACFEKGSTTTLRVVCKDLPSESWEGAVLRQPELVAALIDEAKAEFKTKNKDCVLAVGEPFASLRKIEMPPMTAFERDRAAKFEAARIWNCPARDLIVKTFPIGGSPPAYALGVARKCTVDSILAAARVGGLSPVAIDYDALALGRCFPQHRVVTDVGLRHARVHLYGADGSVPQSITANVGSAIVTKSIQEELALSQDSAEARKRIVGTSGAGVAAREVLLGEIALTLRGQPALDPVALVGNGSRLPGLCDELTRATGRQVFLPIAGVIAGGAAYPADVARAMSVDAALAIGLAMWKKA